MTWSFLPRGRARPGPARLAALAAAAAVAIPVAVLAGPAAIAVPAVPAATVPFGLIPVTAAGQPQQSYFRLAVQPGRSAPATAVLRNPGDRAVRLKVTAAVGVTAGNSGSAYETPPGRCTGPACWLRGLPGQVLLAARSQRELAFRVVVPPGTPRGQYLAGITAQRAAAPRPVRVGSGRHTAARAIIIDQVTVGVAVTVGPAAQLRSGLAVTGVTAAWIGTVPRLTLAVRNTGQRFSRAAGHVRCAGGGPARSYPVLMETVLPGGHAALAVNARGLAAGQLRCTVALRLDARQTARWSGQVTLADRVAVRTYHPARGVFVSVPQGSVPPWGYALLILGGLILVMLVILVVMRRRGSGGGPRPGTGRRRAARRRPARRRPAAGTRRRAASPGR